MSRDAKQCDMVSENELVKKDPEVMTQMTQTLVESDEEDPDKEYMAVSVTESVDDIPSESSEPPVKNKRKVVKKV
jgi:hypothetical protein